MRERNDEAPARETARLVRFADEEDVERVERVDLRKRQASWREVGAVGCLLGVLVLALYGMMQQDDARAMHRICTSRECLVTSHELLRFLNESADPCDDFYEYATGGWRARHAAPQGQAGVYGVHEYVQEHNERIMRDMIADDVGERPRADMRSLQKMRMYMDACTNTSAQDAAGAEPLVSTMRELAEVLAVPTRNATADALAWLHAHGFDALFETRVGGDAGKAPRQATPTLGPGGLGLRDAQSYNDTHVMHAYHSFVRHAMHMAKRAMRWTADADDLASYVLALETQLAQLHPPPREATADPAALYHPVLTADLQVLAPGIAWGAYFRPLSPRVFPHKVILASEPYMRGVSELVWRAAPEALHAYFYWVVMRDAGRFLGPNVALGAPARQLANFVAGVPLNATAARDRVCVRSLNAALGGMAGRFFVERALTPMARSDVLAMTESVRAAFRERVSELPWFDARTRKEARAKAEGMSVQVGYPRHPDVTSADAVDAWYDTLLIADSYFLNEMAARMFRTRTAWSQMGGELAVGTLGGVAAADVYAGYSEAQNDMVMAAGVLQRPYFDARSPMYVQYGALGTVIGRELTHAFDAGGRMYDAQGLLRDWWTRDTAAEYAKRQRCVEAQYGPAARPGDDSDVHGPTSAMIREHVAHAGGVAQGYRAWQHALRRGDMSTYARNMRLPGLLNYTHEQLFFLAHGAIWARTRESAGAYDPVKLRVNRVLANFAPFAAAFGCKPRDRMGRLDRCELW